MDYYETFKQTADERCKGYFKTIVTLTKFLEEVTKRRVELQGKIERTQRHIADLHERAVDSIGGGQNSWAKYQSDVKKNEAEKAACVSELENIERTILPKNQSKLQDAERNLKIVLYQLAHESRKAADTDVLEPAMRNLLAEIDKQQEGVARGFAEYGQVYVANDESLIPGIWPCQEINDLKVRLGMTANPEPTHEEVFRNYLSPPESKSATETPVSEPIAEHPGEISSVTPDEPPTPQEPIDDPFGEPVETNGLSEREVV